MQMMNLDQKIKISDSVFAQEVDDEMVLLDMNSENYFGLDEVGSDIWSMMQQKETLREVYDAMLDMYDVDKETLMSDMEIFIGKLLQSGLIALNKRE